MQLSKPSRRKEATLRLSRAASYHLIDKGFSTYLEVGLKSSKQYSNLRADVLALNTSGKITIVEVKSCWNDYATDTKWSEYIGFCNQMYFIITKELFDAKGDFIKKELKEKGVGLLVLHERGSVVTVGNASKRKVDGKIRRWLITKLAWRGGFCKASIDRSMRFSVTASTDRMPEASLIQFLGYCDADRKIYLAENPRCGYKKYLHYPVLNTDQNC